VSFFIFDINNNGNSQATDAAESWKLRLWIRVYPDLLALLHLSQLWHFRVSKQVHAPQAILTTSTARNLNQNFIWKRVWTREAPTSVEMAIGFF
jgi:hypothetical protein